MVSRRGRREGDPERAGWKEKVDCQVAKARMAGASSFLGSLCQALVVVSCGGREGGREEGREGARGWWVKQRAK